MSMIFILILYKLCNITIDITKQSLNTFENDKLQIFRYNEYLAIHNSILLSYVVDIDVYLSEHCSFYWFR